MLINWTDAGPTNLATFLASLVEFIEAMTIVLAVNAVRGWRGAWAGLRWRCWSYLRSRSARR